MHVVLGLIHGVLVAIYEHKVLVTESRNDVVGP
jgi:hypothetical protein